MTIDVSIGLSFSVEGEPSDVDPAKLVPLALKYGFSAEVHQVPAVENMTTKNKITFTAGYRAEQNPVKALDDAIDLIFESQSEFTRKDLIEWARRGGKRQ